MGTEVDRGHCESWCTKISRNDLSLLHLIAQCQPQEEARNRPHPLGESTIGLYMSEKHTSFVLSDQDLGLSLL